jgi:hypothetical protein
MRVYHVISNYGLENERCHVSCTQRDDAIDVAESVAGMARHYAPPFESVEVVTYTACGEVKTHWRWQADRTPQRIARYRG